MDDIINAGVKAFAATISTQPIGLADHHPESWAKPGWCFDNVARKIGQDGGRVQFGWTFHHCYVANIPSPGYLFANHHAVWHSPDGRLIDITLFHPTHNRPLIHDTNLFLVDDKALPVRSGNIIAPLPNRFFALSADDRLKKHVEQLTRAENQKCQDIYDGKF